MVGRNNKPPFRNPIEKILSILRDFKFYFIIIYYIIFIKLYAPRSMRSVLRTALKRAKNLSEANIQNHPVMSTFVYEALAAARDAHEFRNKNPKTG